MVRYTVDTESSSECDQLAGRQASWQERQLVAKRNRRKAYPQEAKGSCRVDTEYAGQRTDARASRTAVAYLLLKEL